MAHLDIYIIAWHAASQPPSLPALSCREYINLYLNLYLLEIYKLIIISNPFTLGHQPNKYLPHFFSFSSFLSKSRLNSFALFD